MLHQDKQEEQQRNIEYIKLELEEVRKEKAAVEAHADVLEKALMKLSMDNSKSKVQVFLCFSSAVPALCLISKMSKLFGLCIKF